MNRMTLRMNYCTHIKHNDIPFEDLVSNIKTYKKTHNSNFGQITNSLELLKLVLWYFINRRRVLGTQRKHPVEDVIKNVVSK